MKKVKWISDGDGQYELDHEELYFEISRRYHPCGSWSPVGWAFSAGDGDIFDDISFHSVKQFANKYILETQEEYNLLNKK